MVRSHTTKVTSYQKILISDDGIHLQFKNAEKYIRLAEDKSIIKNVQLESDTFVFGPKDNIISAPNTFSIRLGSTNSNCTYFTTSLNGGVYLSGSNFKIENGALSGGTGGTGGTGGIGSNFNHPSYNGTILTGANVISQITVGSDGSTTTASRLLSAGDIGASLQGHSHANYLSGIQSSYTITANNTTNTGIVYISQGGAFFDYYITNNNYDARAGTVISVSRNGKIKYSEHSTMDIGDTSDIKFEVEVGIVNNYITLKCINSGANEWTLSVTARSA